MRVRAIVFDLDGTLIDSLDDIATALDAALTDHGLPRPSRATVRSWIGGGAGQLVARAVEQLAGGRPDGPTPAAVLARFRAHYDAAPCVHTRVFPDLAPVLDELAAADLALAVLTNKPHELAVRIADLVLAPWPFALVIGARAGVPLKPDPRAALDIAQALGVEPTACAFVGDSDIDLHTAHAAGMRPVGVTWGYRPREELVAARPALLADHPDELRVLAR